MFGRLRVRALRRVSFAGIVLHALVLLVAPFEHHDLICHLKTPQHCTSCIASPAGDSPDPAISPGACRLVETGTLVTLPLNSTSALLAPRTPGRSPPPFA